MALDNLYGFDFGDLYNGDTGERVDLSQNVSTLPTGYQLPTIQTASPRFTPPGASPYQAPSEAPPDWAGFRSEFNDPISSGYEARLNGILDQLSQPDPRMNALFKSFSESLQPDPRLGEIYSQIQRQTAETEARQKQALGQYKNYVLPRIDELRLPAYTQTQEAARRVGSFDAFERERQVAKQNVIQKLAQLGHASTSGTVANALAQVDQQFNSLRSGRENELLLEGINLESARKSEADRLMASLQAAQLDPSLLAGLLAGSGGAGQIAQAGNTGRNESLALLGSLQAQLAGQNLNRLTSAAQLAYTLPQLQLENLRLVQQLFPTGQIPF